MSWEYWYLKRELQLPDDPVLRAFERYCVDSWKALKRLEWSVKVVRGEFMPNRFLHMATTPSPLRFQARLFPLLNALDQPEALWPIEADTWQEHVADRVSQALVAYAGPDPTRRDHPAIKVYLGVNRYDAHFHAHVVRPLFRQLPKRPPPPGVEVLIAATLIPGSPPSPRLYLTFGADTLGTVDAAEYLQRVGVDPAAVVGYPRVSVGLKSDGTDMVSYKINTPGSPVRTLAERVAADRGLLAARMRRVTYCGLPFDFTAAKAGLQAVPDELNLYVRLDA